MKVIVTGGAGYIGSHVVLELLEKGYEVTVYDNLYSGKRENLFPATPFIHGDILNYQQLLSTFSQGFDVVVHMAAFKAAGQSLNEIESYSQNNITGTINVLNAMSQTKIPYFLFSSSAAIFGEPHTLPVDESHPKIPTNYYGFTKLVIEDLLDWYAKANRIHYASLRYFNAAGYDKKGRVITIDYHPTNLIPILMETAAGLRPRLEVFGTDYPTQDGSAIRDYVHVSDLARAHALSLDYIDRHKINLALNLGSENGISVLEMIEEARKITGKEIPFDKKPRREGDPARLVASSKKIRDLLGWKAKESDATSLIQTSWNVYKGQAK